MNVSAAAGRIPHDADDDSKTPEDVEPSLANLHAVVKGREQRLVPSGRLHPPQRCEQQSDSAVQRRRGADQGPANCRNPKSDGDSDQPIAAKLRNAFPHSSRRLTLKKIGQIPHHPVDDRCHEHDDERGDRKVHEDSLFARNAPETKP